MAKKKRKSTEEKSACFPSNLLNPASPPKLAHRPPELLWPDAIWVQADFLSADECRAWINHFESCKNTNVYMQQRGTRYLAARECHRLSCPDDAMARRLFERLRDDTQILQQIADAKVFSTQQEPVAFHSNLRLYKYEKSMSFGKHVDGSNEIPGVGTTRLTVLIYLSDCGGGATRFFDMGRQVAFEPRVGSMLLHVHGDKCLEHQADAVTSGVKYVLRTDLVYRKKEVEP